MQHRRRSFWLAALLPLVGLALAGCGRTTPPPVPPPPPAVTVSYPIEREVTDYADFTGRLAAVDSVEVRPRVWGYLDKVNFKEGALVQEGEVLFEIDPRTYQTALAQAEGNLSAMQAKLTRLNANLVRADNLLGTGAIRQEEYDTILGERDEAAASLEALRAAVKEAKLDLGFTRVTAPISGRVGRALVTEGNLIAGGQTGGAVLTTIVSVDPIYAYFDVDEHTVQYVRRLIRQGKARSAREAKIPVWIGLSTENGHPHEGVIDFVDNRINPRTGTLRVRGVFPNQSEMLTPGFFARVRVPIGNPHQALLVTNRALDNDQGQKILYVVDDDQKVVVRPVKVGALHDGLRVIEEGLNPGERVIVTGLLQVRAGITVDAKLVDMPE